MGNTPEEAGQVDAHLVAALFSCQRFNNWWSTVWAAFAWVRHASRRMLAWLLRCSAVGPTYIGGHGMGCYVAWVRHASRRHFCLTLFHQWALYGTPLVVSWCSLGSMVRC